MFAFGKKAVLLLALCLALLTGMAAAALGEETGGVLVLPENTTTVEAYAFLANTQITQVVLPDGLVSIGEYAFDGCTGLSSVAIPASVTAIGKKAFPAGVQIEYEEGSYAQTWAEENGYNRERAYHALIIGQEYTGTNLYLPGCFRDAAAMKTMLETMTGTPYQITLCQDLTAAGILSAIDTAFGGAGVNDVCLFYYAGHGNYSYSPEYLGALQGVDSGIVKIGQLKSALDNVAGDKIVILDSCYSGAAITAPASALAQEEQEAALEEINAAIVSMFSTLPRANMATGGYYLLTAASQSETSVSGSSSVNGETIYFGAFTYGLLYGSGYNEITGKMHSSLYADDDASGSITLKEAYEDAYARAVAFYSAQHAQCYPEDSSYVLWGR